MFESSQPVPRVSLLDVRFEGYIVREDDDRQEHRMSDLQDALLEMLDTFHNVGAGRAFAEAGRDAVVYVVGEREFPAAGVSFLPDVAFAVDDFCLCSERTPLRFRFWGRGNLRRCGFSSS